MASKRDRIRKAGVNVTGEDHLRQLADRLLPLAQKKIQIGVHGDADLAEVAAAYEYGSVRMRFPARSFIRSGQKEGQAPIGKLVRSGMTEVARGQKSMDAFFKEIGETGLDRMVKSFNRSKQLSVSAQHPSPDTDPRVQQLLEREEDLEKSLAYDIVREGE